MFYFLSTELARRFHNNNNSANKIQQLRKNNNKTEISPANNFSSLPRTASDSKREGRRQRHSMSSCSQLIGNLNRSNDAEPSRSSNTQTFNHSLFNDTTRLRRTPKRPSLSNMFSHEEPLPDVRGGQLKHSVRFFSPCRPKEPPPPPPPVASVLTPITPPKQFSPFELKRINLVISGGDQSVNSSDYKANSELANNKKRQNVLYDSKHETIEEEEDDDIVDEFSTDEFSDDEFGTDEEEKCKKSEIITLKPNIPLCEPKTKITYQNLKDLEEKHKDNLISDKQEICSSKKSSKLKESCFIQNKSKHIYDDVNTDIYIEEDSLEEKISFSEEYETEGDVDEVVAVPSKLVLLSSLLSSKTQQIHSQELSNKFNNDKSEKNKIEKKLDEDKRTAKDSLIEQVGDKMIMFTSVAAQASSAHQDKKYNQDKHTKKINFGNKKIISLDNHSPSSVASLPQTPCSSNASTSSLRNKTFTTSRKTEHQFIDEDDQETFVDNYYPSTTSNASQLTKSDNASTHTSSAMAIKSDHQILISSCSLVDVKGISSNQTPLNVPYKEELAASLQRRLNASTATDRIVMSKEVLKSNVTRGKDSYANKKGVLFEINSVEKNNESEENLVDVNTISINKGVNLNSSNSHYFDETLNGGCSESITLDSLEPIKPPRKKKMAKLQKEIKVKNDFALNDDTMYTDSPSIERYGDNNTRDHPNTIQDVQNTNHSKEVKMSKSISQKISSTKTRSAESRQRRPNISAPILLATTLNPNDTDAHQSINPSSSSSTFSPESLIHELQNGFHESHSSRTNSNFRFSLQASTSPIESATNQNRYQSSVITKTNRYNRSLSNPHSDQISSFFNDQLNQSRYGNRKKIGASQQTSSNGGGEINSTTNTGERITFDDLKRYAKKSFNSTLTNAGFQRSINAVESATENGERKDSSHVSSRQHKSKKQGSSKSRFYETDNLRETMYVQDSAFMRSPDAPRQSTSPYPSSEHIYEEIVDCKKFQSTIDRPLPPIPEGSNKRKPVKIESSKKEAEPPTNWNEKERKGSIFEGASKYDILHYLNSAKDRLGSSTDFEMEKEEQLNNDATIPVITKSNDENHLNNSLDRKLLAKRKSKSHRISSISNASDCSTNSSSSGNSQYSTGSIHEESSSHNVQGGIKSSQDRLNVRNNESLSGTGTCGIGKSGWVEIERADSGVGSESSKSSKASIELRRAASMSKSSDSGSSSTSSNADHQEIFTLTNATINSHQNVCQDCDLICDR